MKVKWTHYSNNNPIVCETSWIEPKPFIQYISQHRSSEYFKCPAFQNFYKNTFVILCPFDFSLQFRNGQLQISSEAEYADKFFDDRSDQNKSFKMVSFESMYCFFSSEQCTIQTLHPSLCEHLCPSLKDISFISGVFDISKWARPVEFAFELIKQSSEISFKRGDPLFLVKFSPLKDSKVLLERLEYSKDIDIPIKACIATKLLNPNNSMNKNYSMAEYTMNILKRKLFKRCPFSFFKK